MKTVTTEELLAMKAKKLDFVLINTLNSDRFDETHIPASINVPVSQGDFVSQVLEASGSKEKPLIVYCASPECNSSTKAAKWLDEAGFDVADYEGGAAAWRKAGQPLAS